MKREQVRQICEGFLDVNGDELYIYDADGCTAIGVAPGADPDAPSKAVILDAPALACVIAALSAKLAAALAAESTAYAHASDGQAAAKERPVADMSRNEIRSELQRIWSAVGTSYGDIAHTLARIEDGASVSCDMAPRTLALCVRLRELSRIVSG